MALTQLPLFDDPEPDHVDSDACRCPVCRTGGKVKKKAERKSRLRSKVTTDKDANK
jgi:hypothetical protein